MTEVGEKILMRGGMEAIVRYIGQIDEKDGSWVGLELDKEKGKNDGSLKGKRYFECPKGHGIFVRYERFKSLLNTKVERQSNEIKESPLKDNSMIFQDCIIKVDDIRNDSVKNAEYGSVENDSVKNIIKDNCYLSKNAEYGSVENDSVKNIIKDNCYLSKINEYSKEVERLRKSIKKKGSEIEDLDKKYQKENLILRNKLLNEIKRSKEISKNLNETKKGFLNAISKFQRDALESYTEIKYLINDLKEEREVETRGVETSEEEHSTICSTFKGMMKSFIEDDQVDLEDKISKLKKLFSSKDIFY